MELPVHIPTAAERDFEALLGAQRDSLVVYAARLVNDDEAAQDIIQEVFMRCLQRPPEGQEPRVVAAWLRRVAHNLCVDHIRRERRMKAGLEEMAAQEPATSEPSLGRLHIEDVRRLLDRLMDQLTPTQRLVLTLRAREGKSYREISESTGLSVSSVGVHLYQAVRRLSAAARPATGGEVDRHV